MQLQLSGNVADADADALNCLGRRRSIIDWPPSTPLGQVADGRLLALLFALRRNERNRTPSDCLLSSGGAPVSAGASLPVGQVSSGRLNSIWPVRRQRARFARGVDRNRREADTARDHASDPLATLRAPSTCPLATGGPLPAQSVQIRLRRARVYQISPKGIDQTRRWLSGGGPIGRRPLEMQHRRTRSATQRRQTDKIKSLPEDARRG